jgi:hypothetical protein
MTSSVHLGPLPVSGGFFLVRRNGPTKHSPVRKDSAGEDYEHVFTNRDASTIKEHALRLIRSARRRIFIASFRIGDKDLIQELERAVHRLRGGVYVISALDERSLARGLSDLDEDAGVDIQAQKKDFALLARAGMFVRGHESCHAKFMVVDDSEALVSSANLESSAFQRVTEGGFARGPTGENGVLIRDLKEVDRLSRLFTRMWFSECTWEILPERNAAAVTARTPSLSPCDVPCIEPGVHGATWTAHKEHFILHALHELILSTNDSLVLSTFSLNGMVENPRFLIEPLSMLIERRSPSIRILVRTRNHFASHRRDATALASMGVQIFADDLNHAKGAIADNTRGMLFSANFDAAHGLCNGVEVGAMLPPGSNSVRDAANFFEQSMTRSGFHFKVNPSHQELASDLAASWTREWPLENDIPVVASHADWRFFLEESLSSPVLFSQNKGGSVRLHVGTALFSVSGDAKGDQRYTLKQLPTSEAQKSSSALLESWLSSRGPREGIGGLCTASFHFMPGR